jgi:hypothetical protein
LQESSSGQWGDLDRVEWVTVSVLVQRATFPGSAKNHAGCGEPHFAVEQDGGTAKALVGIIR